MAKKNEEKEPEIQEEEKKTEPVPEETDTKETEELRKAFDKLSAELQSVREQYVRALAEYDNYRKRTEKEKSAIYGDATAAAVQEFLPVRDNLERALGQKECSVEDMRKGVEMVESQFCAAMKKLGVEEMAGEGEDFNPDLHNAVAHIEDETLGENVVSAVFQKGYLLKDKVIRHAMVQVAN